MKDISKTVHSILDKTTFSPQAFRDCMNGDGTRLERELASLNDFMRLNHPKKLYKYRAINKNSIYALLNDDIYFSRADFFNDPYDCSLYFNKNKIVKKIYNEINLEIIKERYSYVGSEALNFIISNYEENRQHFIKNVEEGLKNISSLHQKNMFVSCFSESVTSPLMWSHYSNNHMGFVVEYSFDESEFFPSPYVVGDNMHWQGFRSLLPVYYSNKKVDGSALVECYAYSKTQEDIGINSLDFSAISQDLLLATKLSLVKSKHWSYEKEWRMMISREWPIAQKDEKWRVKQQATAIYLGERIKPQNKKRLKNIARLKNIPVFEMYSDPSSKNYEMKFREIKY